MGSQIWDKVQSGRSLSVKLNGPNEKWHKVEGHVWNQMVTNLESGRWRYWKLDGLLIINWRIHFHTYNGQIQFLRPFTFTHKTVHIDWWLFEKTVQPSVTVYLDANASLDYRSRLLPSGNCSEDSFKIVPTCFSIHSILFSKITLDK